MNVCANARRESDETGVAVHLAEKHVGAQIRLSLHILQNPDSSGNFHDWQDESVSRERQLHHSDISQNHLSGAFKGSHSEGGAHSLTAGRIESDAPDVEEARTI